MRHAPGLLAVTEPAPVRIERILHAPDVAARPDGMGRLLLAAADLDRRIELTGGDVTIPAAVDELLDRARRAVPRLAGVPAEVTRIGYRALTADGLPAIGPVPGWEGAYVAVMHSGVTLAPLVGRLVAGELVDGHEDGLLDDYRPGRFAEANRDAQLPDRG
jgi:glycine/D-amino acid oxidase-like deaminating enzyme